jgi:hypothetical protein
MCRRKYREGVREERMWRYGFRRCICIEERDRLSVEGLEIYECMRRRKRRERKRARGRKKVSKPKK